VKAREYQAKLDAAAKAGDKKDSDKAEPRKESELKRDLSMEALLPVLKGETPLLVHCERRDDILSALRIADEFKLKIILDGAVDAYKVADEIKKRNIPVMAGPRGFRYDPAIGQVQGQVAGFADRGITALGVNTDAPVVPQEELWFQATMAIKLGWNEEAAYRGLTIEPAKALMIDQRVGSLEVGKDADIIISTGSILDPRHYVVMTLIDGAVAYDIKKDRRRF
jgi:imidazolonepropionase-like amidohydrolase